MIIKSGDAAPSINVLVLDDAGLPVTGKVYTDFPAVKYSIQGANNSVSITLASLANENSAYASGGIKERGSGWYRMDLPAAAVATAGTRVSILGDASNFHILAPQIDVLQCTTAGVIDTTTAAMANNVVTASAIANDAITNAKIADNAISNSKIANDAISAGKFDETTAYPLKSDDSGDTQIARKGNGTHTLKTIEDKIDTIDGIVDGVAAYSLLGIVKYKTTGGLKAHIKCVLVDSNGQRIDLSSVDPAATCAVEVFAADAAPQFSMSTTDMGSVNAEGWFEAEYANPGFASDVAYTALFTVVADGKTYADKVTFFAIW